MKKLTGVFYCLLSVTLLFTIPSCQTMPVETRGAEKMDAGIQPRQYLEPALQVGAWLQSVAIETKDGKKWPADPENPNVVTTDLYNGMGGVVLFFVELYRATGDQSFLAEAEAGADYLLASLPEVLPEQLAVGLHTGISGTGYVLEEMYKITGKAQYHDGARHCLSLVVATSKIVGSGMQWSKVTDIISGTAGTGLFLLYMHQEMKEEWVLELAAPAGKRLLELGFPENGGLNWKMDPDYERLMPNFSHGTAGISYFLARLHRATGKKEFLDGALAGGRYLQSITNDEGLICHHQPGGEDLFYLGWCHGPIGTGRLYYELWRQTNDDQWHNALIKASQGVLDSGITEKQTEGFWNNVGQCCGSAGVADYFLNLYQQTQQLEYLRFGSQMLANLLDKATKDEKGVRWSQAEHRSQPDFLVTQTGYAQGAAGIGLALLHWDAHQQNRKFSSRLPDSPF
ncbi:MAG: hypothetical protein GY869_17805 [Planctomycetes bacterium]|nr:hypothetical protein [Planctomycetota bacterium]